MHLKRFAGFINLAAAAVFITMGTYQRRTAFIVFGVVFLLLGFIRLRQNPPGPPAP